MCGKSNLTKAKEKFFFSMLGGPGWQSICFPLIILGKYARTFSWAVAQESFFVVAIVQPKDELIKTAIVAIATIASLLQVLLNEYSMTG